MIKKIISVLLIACLLIGCCAVFASADELTTKQKADALYLLGLFKGTDKGYELEKKLTREQGVVMELRMFGQEKEALNGEHACVFDDVYDWAKGYVGYANEKGITLGISETKFGYGMELTDAQFLTMLLRALGYEEGEGKDFVWDTPYELAAKVGLIDKAEADAEFTRGDMVEVCWRLLNAKYKGGNTTAADQLVKDGVVTDNAIKLAKSVADGSKTLDAAQKELNGGTTDPGGDIGGGGGGGGGSATPINPNPGPSADEVTVGDYETDDLDP